MMYESTRALLRSIVQSLTGSDVAWDDQIESGRECLYEMHQMTRALTLLDKTAHHRWAANIPDLGKLQRAIPHVKEMVAAIQHRDQATALHTGRAALSEMNGMSLSKTDHAIELTPASKGRP
jgi:hypothetical protein